MEAMQSLLADKALRPQRFYAWVEWKMSYIGKSSRELFHFNALKFGKTFIFFLQMKVKLNCHAIIKTRWGELSLT